MSIIKNVTLQKIVAHDFRYDSLIIATAFSRLKELYKERHYEDSMVLYIRMYAND